MEIAVIGAGLAGLAAARDLTATGHRVVVWEKSRGAGGRTATRRGPDGSRFDHGAPALHDGAANLAGAPALEPYGLRTPDGVVALVVGAPAGNAPAKALAEGLDLRTGVRVGALRADGARWALTGVQGERLGAWDAVVVTAPAPQAAELLDAAAPQLARTAASVAFAPCWAVMAAWSEPLGLPFAGARAVPGLAWAVAEAPKPGRAPGERWVLQLDATESTARLDEPSAAVVAFACERLAALAGRPLRAPDHSAAHLWRYARPVEPLEDPLLERGTLVVAGDWCGGDDAGAALRSGRAAAATLDSRLGVAPRAAPLTPCRG